MPLYDRQCSRCGHVLVDSLEPSGLGFAVECPACHAEDGFRRVPRPSVIQIRGFSAANGYSSGTSRA